eukprot:172875-Amorphochlora_amoeboformis.AAC.2
MAASEISFDDVSYEEDILRNPFSLKHWWWYLEFKSKAPKKVSRGDRTAHSRHSRMLYGPLAFNFEAGLRGISYYDRYRRYSIICHCKVTVTARAKGFRGTKPKLRRTSDLSCTR